MRTRDFLILAAAASFAAACQQDGNQNANGAAPAGNDAQGSQTAGEAGSQSIGQALEGSADHSRLMEAIQAAGITETLGGSGPYTVFAPTNAAFDALPEGALQGLMQPDAKGELTALLTYHVVPGTVTAEDLGKAIDRGEGQAELATLGGANLVATRADNGIVIRDAAGGQARVSRADQLQSNGVIHVVDAVLMPGG